jgi:oligopeptide/dipeptide ABC transporter ATP-binding protein
MTIGASIAEPMENMGIRAAERRTRIRDLLEEVRLPAAFANRYPRELSGGQAQRVAVARALAVQPALIVLDEPTASLDVSIQGHIVNLLLDLQERHALTYLFVSHDLVVVRQLASRIAVMYLGRVVELAGWSDLFTEPLHPYAAALLSGIPKVDAVPGRDERIILAGEPPSPIAPPSGCVFHPRCPIAREMCAITVPPLREVDGRLVACHFPGELRVVEASAGR